MLVFHDNWWIKWYINDNECEIWAVLKLALYSSSDNGAHSLYLQGMFDWVDIVEHKLDSMSPVGTDLDTVKQQIEELKVLCSCII